MDDPYDVEEVPDAHAFLALTARLREEDPFGTNVIGSVAANVAGGRSYESVHWWVVRDGVGDVVGGAGRTAPHSLLLTPMPPAAARRLGRAIDAPDRRELVGPRAALEAYAHGAGLVLREEVDDVIRVLDDLVAPPAVVGRAQDATDDDLPLLLRWTAQFFTDADLPDLGPVATEASVRARLAGTGYVLWVTDDGPVAFAGWAPGLDAGPGTPRVARVGPVFTDRAQRGRGFGAAVTAEATRRAQSDSDRVMLLADAANGASNRVYERLGYRMHGQTCQARLTTPPTVIADLPASGHPGT